MDESKANVCHWGQLSAPTSTPPRELRLKIDEFVCLDPSMDRRALRGLVATGSALSLESKKALPWAFCHTGFVSFKGTMTE